MRSKDAQKQLARTSLRPRAHLGVESKSSVGQLMDDLDLINSVEQVEAMVNSIQKGVENVLQK